MKTPTTHDHAATIAENAALRAEIAALEARLAQAQRLVECLGLPHAGQLAGKTCADLLPPEVCAALGADERQIIATGAPLMREHGIPIGDTTYL